MLGDRGAGQARLSSRPSGGLGPARGPEADGPGRSWEERVPRQRPQRGAPAAGPSGPATGKGRGARSRWAGKGSDAEGSAARPGRGRSSRRAARPGGAGVPRGDAQLPTSAGHPGGSASPAAARPWGPAVPVTLARRSLTHRCRVPGPGRGAGPHLCPDQGGPRDLRQVGRASGCPPGAGALGHGGQGVHQRCPQPRLASPLQAHAPPPMHGHAGSHA